MSNIRLVEVAQRPVLLSQLSKAEDEIEFLESLFFEMHTSSDKAASLPTKIAVLADLSGCYHKAGYRGAAMECMKRLEPLFFELLADTTRPLHEKMYELLVTGYLTCGSINDAVRVAEATAKAVAKVLSSTDEDREAAYVWLYDQLLLEISGFQNRCERKAVQMHKLSECSKGVCEADQSFVVSLHASTDLLGA